MLWDLCLIYLFLILWLSDLLGTIEEILPSLPGDISVWAMKESVPEGIISLKEKLSTASDSQVPHSHHVASNLKAPYLYIFTSGTTGKIHLFLKLKKNAAYLQSSSFRQISATCSCNWAKNSCALDTESHTLTVGVCSPVRIYCRAPSLRSTPTWSLS